MQDDRSLSRFLEVLRVPTVSRVRDEGTRWSAFHDLRALLSRLYPRVHAQLELTVVRDHSLLFRWPGTGDGAPTVLMAHQDVVDADAAEWATPPFAADVRDVAGAPTVFARGVIDDKASLVGILEAVESALADGIRPRADVYLAFTHNEEVLGDGSPAIVAELERRGVRPGFVLDEGGMVGEHMFGPVSVPVVYVGVGEKGTTTLRLHARGAGGHVSVPPALACTTRLIRALDRVVDEPAWRLLGPVTRRMIASVGPVADGPLARAAALLSAGEDDAAVDAFASVSRDAWAMVHSVFTVTMLDAGHSPNAVPERATATLNVRVSPGHSAAELIESLREIVADDDIEVEVVEARDASAVSPAEGEVWDLLVGRIRAVYGDDVLVVPYINNGGTDSRNYTGISEHVHRFNPVDMTFAERSSLHAIDEHLRVSSFLDAIRFYRGLVERL